MNNYFIHINGKNEGPFTLEEIRNQVLTPDLKVWRDDQEEWQTAQDFPELTDFIKMVTPTVAQPPKFSGQDHFQPVKPPAYSVPYNTNASADAKKIQTKFNYWLGFMIASIVVLFFGAIAIALAENGYRSGEAMGVVTGFTIFLFLGTWIPAIVFYYQTLYYNWKSIQDDNLARTTPGQAVGLLFVPFYSIYWQFVAYQGLAQDMNKYIDRHHLSTATKANDGVALAYCILGIFAAIPWVNFLAIIPYMVVFFIMATNLKNTAISILNAKAMESRIDQIS